MSLLIPEMTSPLVGVSACLNRLSLSDSADITALIPSNREELIAETAACYLRLIRDKLESGYGHFHLDVYDKVRVKGLTVNSSAEVIDGFFQTLVGTTQVIAFETSFLIAPTGLQAGGLLHLFGGVGINVQGINASLSSATIQLNDTVYREIRWKQMNSGTSGGRQFSVELRGNLGSMPISDDMLNLVKDRALAGLDRFITPKPRVRNA